MGINETERLFASSVLRAGFTVQRSPSIRCLTPVIDRNGEKKKIVTTPDFLVTDPETKRSMYVEVTQGNGAWDSKKAQMRVVEAAGIDNYRQLTGDQIQTLLEAPTPEAIRTILYELFQWSPDLKNSL